jgi:class 3 adenylate cyclase
MGGDRPVQCAACGHEAGPEAKFCSQCGTSLAVACPACSTLAPPGARFCAECGTNLRGDPAGSPASAASSPGPAPGRVSSPTAAESSDLARYLPRQLLERLRAARGGHGMEGERRTVTVLFADIKGSTAAAEQLDPEDWAGIVNGAFERLIAPVYRYEGTLARLQGDAVLAFFGAPIAHDDDPVRAVRAGLEITREIERYSTEVERSWGIPIEVRVGVNTGLVVVGDVGSDLRVEYTAVGDAINVAARMEQTADPGTVRVTTDTLALTGNVFDTVELGRVEVRGKRSHVGAVVVRRFLGVREDEGPDIVGRDDELAALDDLCARLRGGSGWIASIVADAGMGKSRLLQELHRHRRQDVTVAHRFDDSGEVAWMYAASRSYAATPYSTMADLLRRWWAADPDRIDFGVVQRAVARAGLDDDVAALLAHLANVPLPSAAASFIDEFESPSLHRRVGQAFSAYLSSVAGEQPTLVVLEDLHWADDLSLALVDDVMELTERQPVGLLVSMRPYREDPTWHVHEVADRDHHHRYRLIELNPLGHAQGLELLESLVGELDVPPDTLDAILERADGNPLFIAEIIRAVRDGTALDVFQVPTSLTGMLTARLDRLPEDSKHAAQVASVLGTEVDRDLLAAVDPEAAGAPLTDLLRRGVLVESTDRPGDLAFAHTLVQEAAYSTILRRTRRSVHERVAEHLKTHDPGAVAQIARHFVAAEDLSNALPFLVEAGQKALRSMSLAEATRLFTQVVEQAPDDADPSLVERAHDGLGEAYSLIPDLGHAEASYQRLLSFGEAQSRPATRVTALNRLAMTSASLAGDLDGARDYLEQARRLAEACGDHVGLAEYHMNSCFVESMSGSNAAAVEHDEAAVQIGERNGSAPIRLRGMLQRASNYVALLDREHAASAVEAALEATEQAGMEESRADVEAFGSGMLRLADGDIHGYLEIALPAQGTLDRFGSFGGSLSRRHIGYGLYLLGDLEGALASFGESRRTARRMRQPFIAGAAASGMALVYATAGLSTPIPELRREVAESLSGILGGFMSSTCRADLGFVDLLTGVPDGASAQFRWGLDSASSSRFIERPRLLAGLTMALTEMEDLDGARASLADAREFVAEKEYVLYNAMLDFAEGRLLVAEGELDRADSVLTAAHGQADAGGQRFVAVHVLWARLRLAESRGDSEQVGELTRAIDRAVDSLAEGIVDDDLRVHVLRRWRATADPDAEDRATGRDRVGL